MKIVLYYVKIGLFALLFTVAGACIAFIIAKNMPVVEALDDYIYSKRFPLKHVGSLNDNRILIVAINNDTIKKLGILPYRLLSDRRSKYAEVISKILEGRPKVIGVDIFFDGIHNLKEDLKLIEVLENAKSPVVLSIFNFETRKFLLYMNNPITSRPLFFGNDNVDIASANCYYQSGRGDKTMLTLWPFDDGEGRFYLPFPIEVVRTYLGGRYNITHLRGSTYTATIGNLKIPAVKENRSGYYTLFSFIKGADCGQAAMAKRVPDGAGVPNTAGGSAAATETIGAFYSIEFGKVMETDPSVFKDKIVLVGVTASADNHATPISDNTPGVVIHANAIYSILNGLMISKMETEKQVAITFSVCLPVFLITYLARRSIGISVTVLSLVGFKLFTDVMFYRYQCYAYYAPFAIAAAFTYAGAYTLRKRG